MLTTTAFGNTFLVTTLSHSIPVSSLENLLYLMIYLDYYSNGYNADEQGYASNSYDVNTKIYDQKANSQDISSDKADSQEMKQEWNGKEL